MIAVYWEKNLNKFEIEIRYVFDFIFSTLGYEYKLINRIKDLHSSDILFYYGTMQPSLKEAYIIAFDKIIFSIPSDPYLLSPGYYKHEEITRLKRAIKLSKPVNVISKKKFDKPIKFHNEKELFYGLYNFDIIGNIFFHLINYEEYNYHGKDKFGRIKDEANTFLDNFDHPYINDLLKFFAEYLESAVQIKPDYYLVKKEFWPQAQDFAASISHNVDRLEKWNAGKIIKSFFEDFLLIFHIKYVFKNFINKWKFLLTNVLEYWNFDIIHEIEDNYKIRSTFFIGAKSESDYDVDYDLDNEDILPEIKLIEKKKKEIALLGSYDSSHNDTAGKEQNILKEISKSKKMGIRQIMYRFNFHKTPEFHRKYGFLYDSSRPILERSGFKNGIAFPYKYLDWIAVRKGKISSNVILELPLNFSDEQLKISRFQNHTSVFAKEKILNLFKSIKLTNGFINLDFSISNFSDIKYDADIFKFTLKLIRKNNAFCVPLAEIASWWKKREEVVIKETFDSFFIYFPQKMEHFTLKVLGNTKILGVQGLETTIKGDRIHFANIEAKSGAKISISTS